MSRIPSTKHREHAALPAAEHAGTATGGRSRLMSWVPIAMVLLFAVVVRMRLLSVPLERDEGEYAYAGQLMLQGIAPYKLAFNMKFPGTYAAYAAIMAMFGQTIVGIHLGFLLVNAATILLTYLLGKRLFTPVAGVAGAAAYAVLSVGRGVLGTQAHATHFVVLAALGATLELVRAIGSRRLFGLVWSGVLFGIAVLMKQHGALFAVFGAAFLAWHQLTQRSAGWSSTLRQLALFFCGVSAPLVLTGVALRWAGVFDTFWFWTFTYAREYVLAVPLSAGIHVLASVFPRVVGPNLAIWAIACLGLLLMWWRRRDRVVAVFATGFLAFSFLAICPGFYFREHYFVLMLPAIALLAGAAVGTTQRRWPAASVLLYAMYGAGLAFAVMQQGRLLFQMTPTEISRAMYGANPFPEAMPIGGYIRAHSREDARVAVLGSEPEILFHAHRHSATGHIYMYGLMESQPFAASMQKEFIRDVEAAKPEYVVLVTARTSWLRHKTSPSELFDWWNAYGERLYRIVGLADIGSSSPTVFLWDDVGTYRPRSSSVVVVYKRTGTE